MAVEWSRVSSFKCSLYLGGTRIYQWWDPNCWLVGGSHKEWSTLASILVERPCCSLEDSEFLAWGH